LLSGRTLARRKSYANFLNFEKPGKIMEQVKPDSALVLAATGCTRLSSRSTEGEIKPNELHSTSSGHGRGSLYRVGFDYRM
jgi:hypothetical protein